MAVRKVVEVWLTEDEVADLLACVELTEECVPLADGTQSARLKLEDALEELENS